MSLILACGDFYCSVCHLKDKNSSCLDGLVDPIINTEGFVIGFKCPECFETWKVI
jgi:hypothetical protein